MKDTKKLKEGVDLVVDFRDELAPYGAVPYVNGMLKTVINKKNANFTADADKAKAKEQTEYINAKIEGGDKKGF